MIRIVGRRAVSFVREKYWIASAGAFGLVAYAGVPLVTPLAGAMLAYNLGERIGVI
jgi:hypothetical protein